MKIETIVTDFMESNCYILIDDATLKSVLIDPGGSSNLIRQKIDSLGLELIGIINTHGHIDHIACDKDFNAGVWIHEEDVFCLKDPDKNFSSMFGAPIAIKNVLHELKHGNEINVGKLSVSVIHTPGHTRGSICLKVEDVIFTGDTLFLEGVGRTDLPGGSLDDIKRSVTKTLFSLDDNFKVYPGHGPSSTIGHEKLNNPFFGSKNK